MRFSGLGLLPAPAFETYKQLLTGDMVDDEGCYVHGKNIGSTKNPVATDASRQFLRRAFPDEVTYIDNDDAHYGVFEMENNQGLLATSQPSAFSQKVHPRVEEHDLALVGRRHGLACLKAMARRATTQAGGNRQRYIEIMMKQSGQNLITPAERREALQNGTMGYYYEEREKRDIPVALDIKSA